MEKTFTINEIYQIQDEMIQRYMSYLSDDTIKCLMKGYSDLLEELKIR